MGNTIISIALVASGGAIGAVSRHLSMALVTKLAGHGFPYGTLTVNVLGSFAMGMLVAWLAGFSKSNEPWHLFLAVGILGSYTTFSTFSLDVITLIERQQYALAAGYILASVLLSVAALYGGLMVFKVLAG